MAENRGIFHRKIPVLASSFFFCCISNTNWNEFPSQKMEVYRLLAQRNTLSTLFPAEDNKPIMDTILKEVNSWSDESKEYILEFVPLCTVPQFNRSRRTYSSLLICSFSCCPKRVSIRNRSWRKAH